MLSRNAAFYRLSTDHGRYMLKPNEFRRTKNVLRKVWKKQKKQKKTVKNRLAEGVRQNEPVSENTRHRPRRRYRKRRNRK